VVIGCRAPAFMIAAMSSPLNRKCLPMNVHGIIRAAAFVLSHDSRTLRIPAASAAAPARKYLDWHRNYVFAA
jgi:hypothetical protein